MAAVAAGRKDEWLALFTPDAVVEDPVGPSRLDPAGQGHRGHDGIGRFWDRNFGADDRPQKPSPPPGHQGLGGSLIGLLIGEDAGPADGFQRCRVPMSAVITDWMVTRYISCR